MNSWWIKSRPSQQFFLWHILFQSINCHFTEKNVGCETLIHVNSQQKHVLKDSQCLKSCWMNLNKACHFRPNSQLRKPHRRWIQHQVIIMIIRRLQRFYTQAYMQEQCVMIASQVWSRMCSHYSWITHLWHTYRAHKEINNRNMRFFSRGYFIFP